ncbi:head completion/stabilization protein [Vibrio tasmaniensis]|uniref:head completion/stabilization protein n=1 Tax=Vibrio tasmaniensis TaxID=212663 RepID=UPI00108073F1|nr:head completion/stabilization protein [Vibrio tasmaniensis]
MFTGSSDARYQDTEITNDGFWPNLNVGDFEKRRGIPAAQDPDRITIALVNAMAEVNRALAKLKTQYLEQGYGSASDVPVTPIVNGKNRLVIQYESAVNSRAKADLLPDIATVHTKDKGDHLADRSTDTRDDLMAESQRVIRNMLGVSRSSAALL